MKKVFTILALLACIFGDSFILADDISDILNNVKIKNPIQKSEPQKVGIITKDALPAKDLNAELEATSAACTQTSKETLNSALNSRRDGEVIVACYKAQLSARDHFSSNGSRLSDVASVIRQDRANFHKFGLRDAQDQSDDFFANASNREALEQMLKQGNIRPG